MVSLNMVPITELLSKQIQEFISKNRNTAVSALMLKMPSFGIDKKWVAAQIEGFQKALGKLPKWAATENIIYPIRLSMEQCSSERTGIFKSTIVRGHCAVDLTGGFGVDSYYLAQSFNLVFYIEQQPELAQTAEHNFSALNQKNVQVFVGNSEEILKSIPERIDLIYLDPARRKETQKVFKLSDCEPNIVSQQDFYFSLSNTILIKTSPMLDIAEGMRQLKGVKKIYIVSVDNECKEVLYELTKDHTSEPDFYCIHDYKKSIQSFSFKLSFEHSLKASLSKPLRFIYEPNPSILKAGAFNAIAASFNVYKLHPSSHLYTSDVCVKEFPGRIFILQNQLAYSKKEVQVHIPEGKANIQVRNFPDSVDDIRKKTGLKDGGSIFIFATTLHDATKTLLVCEKYPLS